MTLNYATPGCRYQITAIEGDETSRRHLYALGFTEHGIIDCMFTAPSGDPIAFSVQGAIIALRKSQLGKITAYRKEGGQ